MEVEFTAPTVACCRNDPQRRALLFRNADDAREYYFSLLRNGTDALLCPVDDSTCVCEVSALSATEALNWMNAASEAG